MRILAISTWFPYPPDNGSQQRAYHLVAALGRAHEVTLLAFQPEAIGGAWEGLATALPGVTLRAVADDPFRHVNRPQLVKFASPLPLAFLPSRPMGVAVKDAALAPWDAVLAIQIPVAQYARRLPNVPRLLDVDTALSYQLNEQERRTAGALGRMRVRVSRWKAQRYEAAACRRYRVCTVAAAHELAHLRALIGGANVRAEVVPNGVDCESSRPGMAPQEPDTLVFNGALTYAANYDAMSYFLRNIYPLILAARPQARLTITGSTAGVELGGLRLDNSVQLSGYLPDIRPIVARAAVCVVPLRQGGGTRLKILQAMALGTPVVATSKGAEGLDVVDGEHLLLADDPPTFAHRTVQLLGNPELRQRLTTNARRLVEVRYDWEAIGAAFVDLVEAMVRNRKENPT